MPPTPGNRKCPFSIFEFLQLFDCLCVYLKYAFIGSGRVFKGMLDGPAPDSQSFSLYSLRACPLRPKIMKKQALVFSRKLFLKKLLIFSCNLTNRYRQNDRKDHEKISCFHRNMRFDIVFVSHIHVFVRNQHFRFCCIIKRFH